MCAKSYLLHQFSFPRSLLLLINEWTLQRRWLWCHCTQLMSSCWTSQSQSGFCCPFLTIAWHTNLSFTSSWSTQNLDAGGQTWSFSLFFFILVFSRHFTPFSFFISYHLLLLTPPCPGKANGVSAMAGWRARGTEKSLQPWTWELLPQKVAHAALWGV